MNIKKAKEEIKNTVLAYLSKDSFGKYKIPVTNQRPLFIIGPPGVGKTAIMEQVARECNIGIVSYTITHHTRQSAIGLPFIEKQIFGDKEYSFTEYTMSEIVATVYKRMEETGWKEGILFIDEINCVSETLQATMLQFLKEKSFGNHKVPEGWVIVTAGNPPEYNKSVREFDMVTLDRLRKIHVTEDYKTWKAYAYKQSIHPSIISYLDIKKEHFYLVETKVDGKEFVTARGWEDLSKMLITYEELELKVDEELIYQYLQHKRVAKDYANYFDFYLKYKAEYSVEEILRGRRQKEKLIQIVEAPFDERLTVVGLLLGKLWEYFKEVHYEDRYVTTLFEHLKKIKEIANSELFHMEQILEEYMKDEYDRIEHEKLVSHLEKEEEYVLYKAVQMLDTYKHDVKKHGIQGTMEAFEHIKELFAKVKEHRLQMIEEATNCLKYAFDFMEEAFMESQEMVIFITELTMNYYSSKFIADYGSEEYYKYNKDILFKDRKNQLMNEVNDLLTQL